MLLHLSFLVLHVGVVHALLGNHPKKQPGIEDVSLVLVAANLVLMAWRCYLIVALKLA